MNKGILTVGIIVLAIMSLVVINVISETSTSSEVDYYLVKETSEAAVKDALDQSFYSNGIPRLDKEKYVESFIRRFSDNANMNRNYNISFYALNEVPPKVTVRVDSMTTVGFTNGDGGYISTSINQMVETSNTSSAFLYSEFNNPQSDIGAPIGVKEASSGGTNKYNRIYIVEK